jgi:hypothetical protein
MTYADYVESLLPEWAKDDLSLTLYGAALALSADIVAEQKIVSATAGLIASQTSPDDVLPYVATERGGLFRYPVETLDQWRNRLMGAASAWEYAGTERCITEQFEAAGYPGVTIISNQYREGPHGEAFPYISHYWLSIPSTSAPTLVAPEWDAVTWGYFWWDTGALPADFVQLCLQIIDKFGDPLSVCRGVEIRSV